MAIWIEQIIYIIYLILINLEFFKSKVLKGIYRISLVITKTIRLFFVQLTLQLLFERPKVNSLCPILDKPACLTVLLKNRFVSESSFHKNLFLKLRNIHHYRSMTLYSRYYTISEIIFIYFVDLVLSFAFHFHERR